VVKNDVLEHLYTFDDFPVFMGCSNEPSTSDITQDMSWYIGKTSGVIQLQNLLPLDILYSKSHRPGEIGSIWNQHHSALAKFINKHSPTSVFEIGGSHGILATKYQQYQEIPWVILEPNPNPVNGCNAKFIKGFLDNNFTIDHTVDTVVHSHVFEHIYNPDDFIQQLSKTISQRKKLIFSIPNMQAMLERKYTNCLQFEHTVFLTEDYVEYMLAKHGFDILNKEYFMNDHSIFYSAVKSTQVQLKQLSKDLYIKNKILFENYITYYQNLVKELNVKIERSSQPVYLFGAHVFSQYLIAFGLNTKNIVSILDNDTHKQTRRLYGTNLIVESPRCLQNIKDPVVILKTGAFSNEIKTDILNNINSTVTFLE
jgi:hypothetical protein